MRIFVSLAENSVETCLKMLETVRFAEVRLDGMQITTEDVHTIFSLPKTLIATHRPDVKPVARRKELMLAAIAAGASYVDLEIDAPTAYRGEIVEKAREAGCVVIVSYHDPDKTPGRRELEDVIYRCKTAGADLVKIACNVGNLRENARLLGLLDMHEDLVVVGMGPLGRITRIVAPLIGSPFTYASFSQGRETAPGQLDAESMRRQMMELQGA